MFTGGEGPSANIKFKVDHKNLKYIYGGKELIRNSSLSRVQSWCLVIQQTDVEIIAIPGTSNFFADYLSRN